MANKWSLRAVCAELGARQIFIKAHCPWQNGKVERLNRTMLTEWAYRQIFETNDQRTAALAPWLEYYNTQPPQRARRTPTDQPPVTNLVAGYS